MRDVLDLCPFADCDTDDLLNRTVEALGIRRGFHNLPPDHSSLDDDPHPEFAYHPQRAFHHDPALRLHLLVSLHHQLQAELLHTTLAAHHHGYTIHHLAILLDRPA